MNNLHLGHRLGAVSSPLLQRAYNESTIFSLQHDEQTTFSLARLAGDVPAAANVAHNNGVNALALKSDILATAGADACIRIWNLANPSPASSHTATYHPLATLPRNAQWHMHSLTSISIYPFDPTPTTLLSTSYDNQLLLTSITPTSLQPVHSFDLSHAVHTHSISPIPSNSPLIAAGTASPVIRLLDLRSGLATHSLAAHNHGAIYALAWSPRDAHVLASGGSDGRVFLFDIRRANAAFASLDLDDAIGVNLAAKNRLGGTTGTGELLNFSAQAHAGPVTSVQFTPSPNHNNIVTAGHDQRIRVWDASTGRNELVHFGPRLKNARMGNFGPLIAPAGYSRKADGEVLLWANDDSRGEITVFGMREGDVKQTKEVRGVQKARVVNEREVDKLRGRGRVNAMIWRGGDRDDDNGTDVKHGLEMVTAHGDGTVGIWRVPDDIDGPIEIGASGEDGTQVAGRDRGDDDEDAPPKKKRKKQDFSKLVEGLTKMK